MKKTLTLLLVLAIMLAGTAALAEEKPSAVVGGEAPDFEVTTIDGETFRLSDCRGKVVYINIWASWCMYCLMEMPDIQKLAEMYPDDLVIIGISTDESEDIVREIVDYTGFTYKMALDRGYEISNWLYPSPSIPYSAFITPDGIVSSIDYGMLSFAAMIDRHDRAAAASVAAEAD